MGRFADSGSTSGAITAGMTVWTFGAAALAVAALVGI